MGGAPAQKMSSNILVPELGESIVDARVARWLKKEGERVAAGDPLVELETDKIDLEVGAPQAGVLARIDRRDGEDVKIGEVLGVIEEDGEAQAPVPRRRPAGREQPPRPRPGRRKGGRRRLAGSGRRRRTDPLDPIGASALPTSTTSICARCRGRRRWAGDASGRRRCSGCSRCSRCSGCSPCSWCSTAPAAPSTALQHLQPT